MDRRIIAYKQRPPIPARVIFDSILLWLVLDRLKAPGWVYGTVFTLMGIFFIASFIVAIGSIEKEVVFRED